MKRPQYVFRPNLNEPQHRRAWALLQQVPPAKRKEFLVQSILAAEQTDRLEKSIRKVVARRIADGQHSHCCSQSAAGRCNSRFRAQFLIYTLEGGVPCTKFLLVMAAMIAKFNELSLVLVNSFASAAVVCLLCKHRKERTHEQIDRNHPG